MTLEVAARPPYTITEVRKNKRLYGYYYDFADGTRAYFASRRQSEIYRGGEATISDAQRSGKAAWALDDETLLAARARGCKIVGVIVKDTGDRYAARIEKWFDRGAVKFINYETKGGSLQRCLALTEFTLVPGEIRL
jgi:hypothetical protein